ncbi:hypothetical protein NKR19_g874 [Coniochaeta hoffmannii]|uniref:Uncharacterized protein n=1 Tax=Coniochaeta hoffmannii TaxID=91930 RepID=A0AA38SL99_9PEZI|nr:hypothetical protein NKR19_g874 [Coniochaeta hoffmannii]
MKLTLTTILTACLLAGASALKIQPLARDSAEYQDYRAKVRALPLHKKGYFHVADDGVARSLGPNNEVLGFVAATPGVLARIAAEAPSPEQRDHLAAVWEGVDGRDVADPWVIKRHLIAPAHRAAANINRRDDVLDARDLIHAELSTPLAKRFCNSAGSTCGNINECIPVDQCTCQITDLSPLGVCVTR